MDCMETNLNLESLWAGNRKISWWGKLFRAKNHGKPLTTPEIIDQNCTGLVMKGSLLKSFLFSTDMALIENNDADAVLAVYPFPPSAKIMKTLIDFSEKPVICGVGGGTTKGKKALEMAQFAEDAGAAGIIVNIPFENRDLEKISKKISIPIVSSIASVDFKVLQNRMNAGVDIFHVTGGKNTADIVREISAKFPDFPIMATGGNSVGSIEDSIYSGADAIVLTPPSNKDLFRAAMEKYRTGIKKLF